MMDASQPASRQGVGDVGFGSEQRACFFHPGNRLSSSLLNKFFY